MPALILGQGQETGTLKKCVELKRVCLHLDEGIGAYKIYRLFIYAPAEKNTKRSNLHAEMILLTLGLMVRI
ncbi:hypothetical protein [Lonsdalea quercina]|uniref:hypothetical protein n=1 Tax=Lonsdalea quercina TaxID=71657 RepID=UPI00397547FF